MTSFDYDVIRANFSDVSFLQLYLLNFFYTFQWGGFEPLPKAPSGYATDGNRIVTIGYYDVTSPYLCEGDFLYNCLAIDKISTNIARRAVPLRYLNFLIPVECKP